VTISKLEQECLSSKLVRDAKAFLQGLPAASPDKVEQILLLRGNIHVWMKPIVQNIISEN
jgi:hypothetical protein